MSFVLFAESFSRYGVGSITGAIFDNFVSRYTTVNGTPEILASARNGQGLRMGNSAVAKTLAHSSRWVTGFAYRLNQTSTGDSSIYEIMNNSNQMFRLLQDADGTLQLRAGNSNTIGVTTRAMNINRWYYLEVDVTLSGTTPIICTAELRINGQVSASGNGSTGFNATQNLSGDATGNYHQLSGIPGVSTSCDFDDLYIKNNAGYYGDIRIIALFPNGDGATLQWTPNSGTVHFDRVNTHPVDLTKYLFETVVGHIDTWDWQDCPGFSGTIKAVNISMDARKDDEGTKSFKIVVGNAGTEALSDEFFVSDVTPEYYEFSLETDPATGLAWTQAGFNAKQFGVKLIS